MAVVRYGRTTRCVDMAEHGVITKGSGRDGHVHTKRLGRFVDTILVLVMNRSRLLDPRGRKERVGAHVPHANRGLSGLADAARSDDGPIGVEAAIASPAAAQADNIDSCA